RTRPCSCSPCSRQPSRAPSLERRSCRERSGLRPPRLYVRTAGAKAILPGVQVILDHEERTRLQCEVDRRRREQMGERGSLMDGYISLSEASGLLGIKATRLRLKVNALGLPTQKVGNMKLIRVEDLDLLRGD